MCGRLPPPAARGSAVAKRCPSGALYNVLPARYARESPCAGDPIGHLWYSLVVPCTILNSHFGVRILRTVFVPAVSLLASGVIARGQRAPPPPVDSPVSQPQIFEAP